MSWDLVEIGSRVEAVKSFGVELDMGAPVDRSAFTIEVGDLG